MTAGVTCKRCGTVFCVDTEEDCFYLSRARVLYCSKACKRKAGPGFRAQRRERRKSTAKVRNQVSALRKRDGDDCWLCLLPIDFAIADINDPMHGSRDHVLPRALGGDGTVANLRLAHRHCNTRRGQEAAGLSAAGADLHA